MLGVVACMEVAIDGNANGRMAPTARVPWRVVLIVHLVALAKRAYKVVIAEALRALGTLNLVTRKAAFTAMDNDAAYEPVYNRETPGGNGFWPMMCGGAFGSGAIIGGCGAIGALSFVMPGAVPSSVGAGGV